MSSASHVLIDFSEAGLNLDRADVEDFLLRLADEMESGHLVQDARLSREVELPDTAKSGMAAFVVGILTAEINRENIRKVVDFLGSQFYGKTVTISGELGGEKLSFNFEHLSGQELDKAMERLNHMADLHIRVLEAKRNS